MWFLFGFITFIGFSIYFGRRRYLSSWKGSQGGVGDDVFDYKIIKYKGKTRTVKIGLCGTVEHYFSLKTETRSDRFFKAIGISKEYQTRNKDFDDLIYVLSDDPYLQRLILGNKQVIDAVLKIVRHLEDAGYKYKSIRNTHDRLWLEFKPDTDFNGSNIATIADSIVPELNIIKSKLKMTQIGRSGSWKDSFALRAAIILATSTGLAISGGLQMFRTVWNHVPFTIDLKPVWIDSAIYGSAIMAVLVFAIFVILGRSARTHIVLIEVLLVGSFGVVSNSFVTLRDINIEFDASQPVIYQTILLDRTISRSRRSTSYYLHVTDWNNPDLRKKIKVSSDFYRRVMVGAPLQITQREGNLGYRWVSSLEPIG